MSNNYNHSRSISGVSDIWNYLIPGSALLSFAFLFDVTIPKDYRSLYEIPAFISSLIMPVYKELVDGGNWASFMMLLLVMLPLVFIVGHLVAAISNIVIDKLMINKGRGYSLDNILRVRPKANIRSAVSRHFYRGIFFWINLVILMYPAKYLDLNQHVFILRIPVSIMILVLATYKFVWGNVLLTLSRSTRFKNIDLSLQGGGRFWYRLKQIVLYVYFLFSLPFNTIGNLLSRVTRGAQIEDINRSKYIKYFRRKFAKHNDNDDIFEFGLSLRWLPHFYVMQRHDNLSKTYYNLHVSKSFIRNMSVSAYLGFLYGITMLSWITEIADLRRLSFELRMAPLLMFVLSLALLVRYFQLHDSESRMLMRMFIFTCDTEESENLK